MKKAIILLADGFEETEALTTHDIFTRSHEIETTLVSTKDELIVTSSMGLKVVADILLKDIDPDSYDFLVLPGGKLGVDNLKANSEVLSLVKKYHEANKPHYAICAAPSILGQLGYLDGKNYTCFPGFQVGKGNWMDEGAVRDGDVITGRSMAYTIEFAEKIVEKEIGVEAVKRIYPGTRGKELQK